MYNVPISTLFQLPVLAYFNAISNTIFILYSNIVLLKLYRRGHSKFKESVLNFFILTMKYVQTKPITKGGIFGSMSFCT